MRRFKLQAVLEYRKRLVDTAESELQVLLENRRALAAAKERGEIELGRLCDELRAAKQEKVQIQEVLFCEECVRFKKQHLRTLEEKLMAADEIVEQKGRELVTARQKKKALEILKEKEAEEFRRKEKRLEMNFLDEVAVLRFGGGGK